MDLPAFYAKQRRKTFQLCSRAPCPLHRACWDQAAKPSPAAVAQPTGPYLKNTASAYTCRAMHAMRNSLR